MERRIVIIGAGPTGLAAGYRLRELGYRNFVILEARDGVGGLASSERTANGFTYDIGGHVLFSHYPYFDALFDRLMGDEYQELVRESWIWMCRRFIPYPFQNNVKYLPRELVLECVLGLMEAQRTPPDLSRFANFEELIHGVFGSGIAQSFMIPYNFKVWAHPAAMMNKEWIGERVAMIDVARVLRNVILDRDDAGWGPNSTFKYPRYGGTGGLFDRMRPYIESNLRLSTPVVRVDLAAKIVTTADGAREPYDVLLSTIPLDRLVAASDGPLGDGARDAAASLRHSGSYIVGVGLRQPCPSRKNWMYFPESDAPFYRVTYLSNYSPDVVPDPATHYSLLAEISHSEFKPENPGTIVRETLEGMVNTELLRETDLDDIVDTHLIARDYTYPTPSLERDRALATLHPSLAAHDVYSRGRFGAWRYEVGNMDHSVAQGVEWVNRIVLGQVDDELTYLARRGC